jgi:riboflavin biosynthesis pyrimidine reductase
VLPDATAYYSVPVRFPKAYDTRPYIISSIVLSADGKMAFMDNKVGPLIAQCNNLDPTGGELDFWCLNMLRAYSDALLIGANTLKNEPEGINYCMDQQLFHQRQKVLGKANHPVQIVVSLDGTDIPFEHPSFHVDPVERLKLCIATSPSGWDFIRKHSPHKHIAIGPFCSRMEVDTAVLPNMNTEYDVFPVIVTGRDTTPDMDLMLYILRRLGIELACSESPTYCGALMKNEFLDEYFINYSMLYAGGTMSPGAIFPMSWQNHPHAQLASIGMHGNGFLYTRQLIRYGINEKKG